MLKKIKFVIVISFILLVSSSSALAEFMPIFPVYESILGGNYSYNYNDFKYQSYISTVYDFDNEEIYYQGGTKFKYDERLKFDLSYSKWSSYDIEGYLYKQGLEGGILYKKDEETQVYLSLFSGDVGERFTEEIDTRYIKVNYDKEIFNNWTSSADLYLDIVSGEVVESDKNYYISNLMVPIKIKQVLILPRIGYSEGSGEIKPYYNLGTYVKGYDNYDIEEKSSGKYVEIGNRMASITIEKETELFPYSSNAFLSVLNAIFSINAGDVLAENERLSDFEIHSSVGAGLSVFLGESSMRLERFLTDKKEHKTLFYFDVNY